MTIIKSSIYLKNHEHEALDTDVTEAFNGASGGERIPITLECFCQITRQTISYLKLSHPDFKAIAYGYIGALLSGDLINFNESTTTRMVSLFMMKASAHGNQLNLEAMPAIKEECLRIWKEESKKLDSVKVKFWSGWLLEAKKNSAHLNLQGVHKIYGHTFTNEIYESLQRHALKYMTVNVTNLNRMFVFMVKNHESWPASTFSDPLRIEAFFNALLKETFIKAHNTGKNLHTTAKAWNAFTVNIESALIDSSIWARPFSDILPRVRTPTIKGEKTNIRETKKGVLVKQKLITDIPLALTDEEAILLLFKDIEADIKLVVDWATAEANDLWDRCQKRKELAKKGRVVGFVPRLCSGQVILATV